MPRPIITIDEDRCDGCGQCIGSCAEGALAVIDGKARLVSEVVCDGLGACLGHCPQGAITITEREVPAFDPAAVERHRAGHACPGAALRDLTPPPVGHQAAPAGPRHLRTWPVQLRLIPPHAPWLAGAHLLVCADCVPCAVPDFHQRWLAGRVLLLGCPKLDDPAEQVARLTAILQTARPASVTVLRMEVPCCGGLAQAARTAAQRAGAGIPVEVVTIAIDGGSPGNP